MSDASQQKKTPYIPVPMPDKDILEHVDLILAKQGDGAKTWGKAEHLALLGNIFAEHASTVVEGKFDNARKDFMATCAQHGLGGNDSQFRQWLASNEGGNRLPESKNRRQADLLSKYD